jgi:uncharacterized protein (TIGR02594 family)
VPWCGLFVAACVDEAGIKPAPIAVRASAWATWGSPLLPKELAVGAVLVFQRPGGGHVGFYVGEDATAYHVLGGNQGDAVTIARVAKSRCVARRWPLGVKLTGKPVQLASNGGPLSRRCSGARSSAATRSRAPRPRSPMPIGSPVANRSSFDQLTP